MNIEERSDVVYQIIELARNNLLNEIQKQKFLLYYNLNQNQQNTYGLSEIARMYNVTPNAIRCSVGRIRNALVNLQDERILALKEILEDYENNQ